ncbi:unnamed protein product [Caretta caretta]
MIIRLAPKQQLQQEQCRQKINIEAFKDPTKCELFRQYFSEKLTNLKERQPEYVSSTWGALRSSILNACEAVPGFSTGKHQDWFYENDWEIQT